MIIQQEQPNDSIEAFARAFSNLVKDATSHLPTREDLDNVVTEKVREATAHLATKEDLDKAVADMVTREELDIKNKEATAHLATKADMDDLKQTVKEGYQRIYSWKDGMYNTFARKDELKPSAFKVAH